ncbi:MAG: type I glyceraldehyde-3-phosphate dehydrogenase [Spirochaetales bacterium]
MAKVAINGLGRIGRATLKIVLETDALELAAINDLIPTDNLAYLLKYDSVYGRFPGTVEAEEDALVINGKRIPVTSIKDPAELPWSDLGIDVVFESTGIFTKADGLKKHLSAGAKYAILSAPAKSPEIATVVHGVNKPDDDSFFSCASCTTNSITPVVEVLGSKIGVKKAMLTTVHAYTSSQQIVDGPSKKRRRGRAAAANLVPTSTGAAVATAKALPQYEGKFDGVAIRTPVPVGSISDITFVTERDTTVDEVNQLFRDAADSDRYREVLGISEDQIVSSDIIQDPHASIVDLTMTQVVDGDLVKVMAWYDNEWGYSNQMVREAVRIAS